MIDRSDEETSREFLRKQSVGHLGCVLKSGAPYVVPVNYLYKDTCIYIHSLPGRKIAAMEANPRVCLQTEEVAADGFEWQSVIAFGYFEKVEDQEKRMEILADFYEHFPRFTPVEAVFGEEDAMNDIVVFRINIDHLTGVAEKY